MNPNQVARIGYVLLLAGIATAGLSALVGAILAHVYAEQAQSTLREHFRFQYRTFWLGCLYSALCAVISVTFIGALLFFVALAWWVVRCARGLIALNHHRPPARVSGWGF